MAVQVPAARPAPIHSGSLMSVASFSVRTAAFHIHKSHLYMQHCNVEFWIDTSYFGRKIGASIQVASYRHEIS